MKVEVFMEAVWKDLPPNISLKDPKNPLSAFGDGMHVYKYAFHPRSGRLLYCYPGKYHIDAMNAVGDAGRFNEYVRVIYDFHQKVAGSRVWGDADLYNKDQAANIKSFETQYTAYKFFKQFDPGLKWIFNLTNNDLSGNEKETLEAARVAKERVLSGFQVEELKENFMRVYTDKRFNSSWGLWSI